MHSGRPLAAFLLRPVNAATIFAGPLLYRKVKDRRLAKPGRFLLFANAGAMLEQSVCPGMVVANHSRLHLSGRYMDIAGAWPGLVQKFPDRTNL